MNKDQAEAFAKALAPKDVFGPDQEPIWHEAWLGLSYGVTPTIFVPCKDGTVQRVRVMNDENADPDIVLNLPIVPRPKERPQFGNGKAFTRTKTRSFENELALLASPHLPRQPFAGDIRIESVLTFKKGVNAQKRSQDNPDIDNCIKSVLDAMNDKAWVDDKQVTKAKIEKRWADVPGVMLKIWHDGDE